SALSPLVSRKGALSVARCPRDCWLRQTARGFPARASRRSSPQAPQEWRGEIERQEIEEGCRFRGRGAEFRPPGRLAPLDEHLQAVRHYFHAWAGLLRIRPEREKESGFSGRDCRERAGIFVSKPGAHHPARGRTRSP